MYLDVGRCVICYFLLLFFLNVICIEQSRKCPLCNQPFDSSNEKDGRGYLLHHIRSKYDYQKYYLPPRRTSPPPPFGAGTESGESRQRQYSARRRRERQWGRGRTLEDQERERADEQLERSIAKRRWVYEWGLYAKVRRLYFMWMV